MTDIESPDGFFLGREYDLEKQQVLDTPVVYEPRDLTTHGVVVGMTGSGKTGLCIGLLEEAALRGVPCVIVDLKGDLSNLLLNFPELRPEDFAPWVDPEAETALACLTDLDFGPWALQAWPPLADARGL